MKRHPGDAALIRFCEHPEATDKNAQVRMHLDDGCERCESRIRIYEEILDSLKSPALQSAPEDIVQCALDRIERLQGEEAESSERVRGIVDNLMDGVAQHLRNVTMALVMDSRFTTALQGIRSETVLQPRHIIFESSEASAQVQIQRKKARSFELIGQFIPLQGSIEKGARVIVEGGEDRTERSLSKSGEFRFSALRPGRIRLAFECNDLRVTTESFNLSEDADA